MATIPEDHRIAELRRFGVSEPLIRLSTREAIHELFRYSCLGPPYYVYHFAGTPTGPPLVPLWDCNDLVVGVWEQRDGLEFIEFSIESVEEYRLLARTEQGFWATQFDFFYECEASLEKLREAAAAVGFRFLEQFLAMREAAECRLNTFEERNVWLQELAAAVDREAGFPGKPGAETDRPCD